MSDLLLLTLPPLYSSGVVLTWWFFKDELSSTQLSPNSITAPASCLPEERIDPDQLDVVFHVGAGVTEPVQIQTFFFFFLALLVRSLTAS